MAITNDIIGGIFLTLLIIVYIPQFTKIYKLRSSKGFSPWFMFFGHTASFWTWSNTLVFYINGWWSCVSPASCAENFVGFGIVVVQWILYFIMYLFYLGFLSDPQELYYKKARISNRLLAWGTFTLSMLLSLIDLAVNLVLLSDYGWQYPSETSELTAWTSFAGGAILTFFLIHYIPQLWETYSQKSAGSISLITLGFMCPGSFFWTVYLALQGDAINGNKGASNPIVWVPYLLVSIMQAILLIMGLYYERLKRKNLYLLFKDVNGEEDNHRIETIEWERTREVLNI